MAERTSFATAEGSAAESMGQARLGSSAARASLVVLSVLAVGAVAYVLSIEALTYLVSDDAYYYFKVARNVVLGNGPTFDGMNATNGFHPLWMIVVLPIFWLFGEAIEAPLRAIIFVQGVLFIGSLLLAREIFKRYCLGARSVLVALGLVFTLHTPLALMFNGLETNLVVFCVLALLFFDSRMAFLSQPEVPSLGARLTLGALLGILVLARLDTAFLIIGIASWAVFTRRSSLLHGIAQLSKDYWPTVVVFLAFLSPYVAWNWLEFGHLTPISGALKTTFPDLVFRWGFLLKLAPYTAATILAGCALLHLWKRSDASGIRRSHLDLITGLWIGCLMHLVWSTVFMGWGTFQWHFAAHLPVNVIIFSIWAKPAVRWVPPAALGVALALVVVAFNGLVFYQRGDHHSQRYAAAMWARTSTPPETVFALSDAGIFAYFSERSTINLDGLINGYDYQESILKGELRPFLEAQGLAVLVDVNVPCTYAKYAIPVRSFPAMNDPGYAFIATPEAQRYISDAVSYRPLTRSETTCVAMWNFADVQLIPVEEVTDKALL